MSRVSQACLLFVLVASTALGLAEGAPQADPEGTAAASPGALRVFLDCGVCDPGFFRQRIPWIDWVRDREVAQVHLLVTTRSAAAATEHTLEFLGREEFQGQDHTLTLSVSVTDTADEERERLARVVRMGLASYAVQTSGGQSLDVHPGLEGDVGVTEPGDDPWDFWILSAGVDGSYQGEARTNAHRLAASFSANRTTDEWKHNLWANTSRAEDNFEFDDGTTFEDVARVWGTGGQSVKTVGEHSGIGFGVSAQRSTFVNANASWRAAFALEYNVFPYDESSQRLLTVSYFAGLTRFNYEEETIFGILDESLLNQGLLVKLDLTRPWGSATVDLEARHFIQHSGQYRVALEGTLSYRIVRGLALNVFAGYAVVRDQRFLARRGATDEEVLLRRRALETDFSAFVSLGVSYTFGSIFNRTVNARLTGRSGRFERVF